MRPTPPFALVLLVPRCNVMRGARYVNFGTDIAGYRGSEVRETLLYVRWLQLGAFCPLMENGGNGAHAPWLCVLPSTARCHT